MNGQGQRRRLPPGGGWKLFYAASAAIGGLGLGTYAIVTADEAVDENAANWTRGFGVFLIVVCLLGAWVLYRKVFPPKARHLKVTLSAPEAHRGGVIDARLEVTRATDDPIELGLVCTEYYDEERTTTNSNGVPSTARVTAEAVAHEDWQSVPANGSVHNVRFEVPADAPFSYRGTCLSFEWRVSARQPKKLRFDRATTVDLRVLP